MRAFLGHPWTIRVCRWIVGLMFLAAALPKIADPGTFAQQIGNYGLIPSTIQNLVAITLPWIELLVGLSLLLGIEARGGGVVAAVLMVVFLAAVTSAWARGLDISCGCTGKDSGAVGPSKIAENVGLLVAAALASRSATRKG